MLTLEDLKKHLEGLINQRNQAQQNFERLTGAISVVHQQIAEVQKKQREEENKECEDAIEEGK